MAKEGLRIRIQYNTVVQDVHMTACGSLALEVPRRNFRSAAVVSGEKVYSRDSEACQEVSN